MEYSAAVAETTPVAAEADLMAYYQSFSFLYCAEAAVPAYSKE